MTEFEAQIEAGKLKHVVNVLRRVNDEAIFEINDQGMTCKHGDGANTVMVQVTLPWTVPSIDANDLRIGINLDRLAGKVLKRATAKDTISISGDENMWHVTRGIHQKSMGLLDPERLRKVPEPPVLLHTAAIRVTGKEFKEIIAEASDISEHITIHASESGLLINAISTDMKPDTYKCTLSPERFEILTSDALGRYTLDYLQDITTDMRATDDVLFRFSKDMPCEIEYVRDGVAVRFMLAPRIEGD